MTPSGRPMRKTAKRKFKKRKTADERRKEAFKQLLKEAEDIKDPICEALEKEMDDVAQQISDIKLWKNPYHEERRKKHKELMDKHKELFDKLIAHVYDPNNPYNPSIPTSGKI